MLSHAVPDPPIALPGLARGVYHIQPRPEASWQIVVAYDGGDHWLAEALCLPALVPLITTTLLHLLDAVDPPPPGALATAPVQAAPTRVGWYQLPSRPAHDRLMLTAPLPGTPERAAAVLVLHYAPRAAGWVEAWRRTARHALETAAESAPDMLRPPDVPLFGPPGVTWDAPASDDLARTVVYGPDGRFMWCTVLRRELVDEHVVAATEAGYRRLVRRRVPSRLRLLRE